MSLLQRCGGILAHSSWQNCCNSATLEGFRALNRLFKVMPQHLNRIQVRTLTRPLQSLHFVFLQPFRGGFAGVFWIIVLLQNPSSLQLEVTNRWPDIVLQDFLVDSRIHGSIYHSKSSRSWSSKTAPDHHTTTTFHCWYDVLFLKCCVTFTPDVMGHTPSKKFNFCLVSPQSISQKSWGSSRCFWQNWDELLCSFCSAAVLVLDLCHAGHFCPVSFLMVESWTLTLTEASEACRSLDVVVGSFVTSWRSRRCALGVILVSRQLLEGHHCSMFSPFVDNGSHCGSLESQSFRNGFITFSRLIDLNYFFLICSWISLDLNMMCSFWGSFGLLHFIRQVLFKWFLDCEQVWQ